MKVIRQPAFLAAVSITVLLSLYLGFVLQRAILFVRSESWAGKGIGLALLVLPVIAAWYLVNEWRLGTAVQRMASRLEVEGRLPVVPGEARPSGRLSEEAAQEAYEIAAREVELAPDDWASWFHLAFAYDAAGERAQARRSLRHAADLFRASRP